MKRMFSILLILTIFFLMAFSSYALAKPLTDQQEVKNVIDQYFTLKYDSFKDNVPRDISPLIEDKDNSFLAYEKERLIYLTDFYSKIGVHYTDYILKLSYDSINVSGLNATVLLKEGHDVYFSSAPNSKASLSGLEHKIILSKSSGSWLITSDDYTDDLEIATKRDVNNLKKLKNEANDKINHLKKESKDITSRIMVTTTNGSQITPAAIANYDILAATSYAYYWSGENRYNTTNYYIVSGNDCTNFVSQCISAGFNGRQHDTGSYSTGWWAGTGGGSANWEQVPKLYNYVSSNVGYGLRGYGITWSSAYPGDIIQLSLDGSSWGHSLFVYDHMSLYGDPMYDIKICAHSSHRQNYPIYNYFANGWNYARGLKFTGFSY